MFVVTAVSVVVQEVNGSQCRVVLEVVRKNDSRRDRDGRDGPFRSYDSLVLSLPRCK